MGTIFHDYTSTVELDQNSLSILLDIQNTMCNAYIEKDK